MNNELPVTTTPESTTVSVNLNRPATPAEAQLAAQEQYESEVEKGKLLLDRLPPNPTYADLREAIWADHERLMASADQK